jgi:hypothetical protein
MRMAAATFADENGIPIALQREAIARLVRSLSTVAAGARTAGR